MQLSLKKSCVFVNGNLGSLSSCAKGLPSLCLQWPWRYWKYGSLAQIWDACEKNSSQVPSGQETIYCMCHSDNAISSYITAPEQQHRKNGKACIVPKFGMRWAVPTGGPGPSPECPPIKAHHVTDTSLLLICIVMHYRLGTPRYTQAASESEGCHLAWTKDSMEAVPSVF